MSIQIHESMINNLALDALSGRTIHEEKVQNAVKDLLDDLIAEQHAGPPDRTWWDAMRDDDENEPTPGTRA